jgi:hypothetical protein
MTKAARILASFPVATAANDNFRLRLTIALSGLLLLIIGCNAGCIGSPNLLTLTKEGIRGQGSISFRGEQIELIDIYPDKLSQEERQNITIGFSSGKQVRIQSITEDLLKVIATPASHYYPQYYSTSHNPRYYVDGYDFEFESGRLKELSVNLYGWPPKDITAFVNISSANGATLKLPCPISDFEAVFGHVKIGRAYYE